jgi:hypothetical protein
MDHNSMANESRSGKRWIAIGALILLLLTLAIIFSRRTTEEVSTSGHVNIPPRVIEPSRLDAGIESAKTHSTSNLSNHVETTENAGVITDDLCGVSPQDQIRKVNETIEQHVARLTDHVIDRWKRTLLESTDARSRAVGFALSDANRHPDPFNSSTPDTLSSNSLVLMAIESNDPAIYALALGHCNSGLMEMTVGPCKGLSIEHWAQIDPDNAVPWMWIASRADSRGNQRLVNEAFGRAASASRMQSYSELLVELALDALPQDIKPLEKAAAGTDIVVSAGGPGVSIRLIDICSGSALQTSQRKEQCSSIADMVATQGATTIEVALAAELGKRLGWPEEKWTALKQESDIHRKVVNGYFPSSNPESRQEFRCEKLLRYDHFIDQLAVNKGNWRAAMKAVTEAPAQ